MTNYPGPSSYLIICVHYSSDLSVSCTFEVKVYRGLSPVPSVSMAFGVQSHNGVNKVLPFRGWECGELVQREGRVRKSNVFIMAALLGQSLSCFFQKLNKLTRLLLPIRITKLNLKFI